MNNLKIVDDAIEMSHLDVIQTENIYLRMKNEELKVQQLASSYLAMGRTYESIELLLAYNLGRKPSDQEVMLIVKSIFKRRSTDKA